MSPMQRRGRPGTVRIGDDGASPQGKLASEGDGVLTIGRLIIQFKSTSRTLTPRGLFRITVPMTMLKPKMALQRLRLTTREKALASNVGYGRRWSMRGDFSGWYGRQMPFPFPRAAGGRLGLGSLSVPSSQLTTALACCDVIEARSDMGRRKRRAGLREVDCDVLGA